MLRARTLGYSAALGSPGQGSGSTEPEEPLGTSQPMNTAATLGMGRYHNQLASPSPIGCLIIAKIFCSFSTKAKEVRGPRVKEDLV